MAITTVAGLKTAMPNIRNGYYSGANLAKAVGAFTSCWIGTASGTSWTLATYPGASLAWSTLDRTSTGAFPFVNPTSGLSYIARAWAAPGSNSQPFSGTLTVYDRLAQTGAITPAASTQTLTGGPTLTRPDANGQEVECWIESITASTATASNYSIRYVNQDGATQTSPVIAAVTTSTIGMMQRFNLVEGDTGIRSVDQFISTGASGGTAQLVLMRKITQVPIALTNFAGAINQPVAFSDFLSTGLAQVPDSACIAFMVQANTTANQPVLMFNMSIVQG
jgi:hypothetical protein